jgi:hypothetical protein
MAFEKVEFADGKYALVLDTDTHTLTALRHGEPWPQRDVRFDNMMHAIFHRVQELEALVQQNAEIPELPDKDSHPQARG